MIGKTKRVNREFVPIYEYERLSPYTARIAQMEKDIEISDERLVEEYERFRQEHPSDGFSTLFKLNHIALLEEGPKQRGSSDKVQIESYCTIRGSRRIP
jgi:hypothetical protein